MKYLFAKNYERVKYFSRWELDYLVLKALSSDLRLSYYYRFFFLSDLYSNGWVFSRVKISNRCFLTYRSGGYVKMAKVSRIMFRRLASFGLLPGLRRSSW